MNERELAQANLQLQMARGLGKLLLGTADATDCAALVEAAQVFEEATAKQYDLDRNGVRRVMGKKDCPEADTDEEERQANGA